MPTKSSRPQSVKQQIGAVVRPPAQTCNSMWQLTPGHYCDTPWPPGIHARDADIALTLQQERDAGGDFVFLLHCFSSTRTLAETAIVMGGYVSFSGILTFPKSLELREIAADIPLDRLLVETDSPYLAPVPYRGKRNEPAFVAATASAVAALKGVEPEALAAATTANFFRLFAKATPPLSPVEP